ncbi:hypothetical protein [Actinomadura alba]|nr:hypothetical protein [Actinomadura alba]
MEWLNGRKRVPDPPDNTNAFIAFASGHDMGMGMGNHAPREW